MEAIDHDGWKISQSGPTVADRRVLLLPGALANGAYYEDLIAELQRVASPIRCFTATVPGNGGAPPVPAATFEDRARQGGSIAAALGCRVVVGHSLGANVALEMAAGGSFRGPVVLLSPSLSRKDESIAPRVLDRLSAVLGSVPYALVLRYIGPILKSSLPSSRADALIGEMQQSVPRDVQRETHIYLNYLDQWGSVADRLCQAGVPAWVVFGEHDDVKLAVEERRMLEACATVDLSTIPDSGHFTMVDRPDLIAQQIVEAIEANP